MFIYCINSDCENYWEDSCTINLENKMVSLDGNGKCENFKEGKSNYYKQCEDCICYKCKNKDCPNISCVLCEETEPHRGKNAPGGVIK